MAPLAASETARSALAGNLGIPRRTAERAKKHPPKPAGPNFLVAERDRLTMSKIKVHRLPGDHLPPDATSLPAVKRNRGGGGDKVSIKMFETNLALQPRSADAEVMRPSGSLASSLGRVYIPKGPGTTKPRPPDITLQSRQILNLCGWCGRKGRPVRNKSGRMCAYRHEHGHRHNLHGFPEALLNADERSFVIVSKVLVLVDNDGYRVVFTGMN